MTFLELLQKIKSGGYDTAVGARRATGRVPMSAEERQKVDKAINRYFAEGSTEEAAPSTMTRKGRKKAAAAATTGVKTARKATAPREPAEDKIRTRKVAAPESYSGLAELRTAAALAELKTLSMFSDLLTDGASRMTELGMTEEDAIEMREADRLVRSNVLRILRGMYHDTPKDAEATADPEPAGSAEPEDDEWKAPLAEQPADAAQLCLQARCRHGRRWPSSCNAPRWRRLCTSVRRTVTS